MKENALQRFLRLRKSSCFVVVFKELWLKHVEIFPEYFDYKIPMTSVLFCLKIQNMEEILLIIYNYQK